MKLIVAGSRFKDSEYDTRLPLVVQELDKKFPDISEIVSGTARGYDRLGERYAQSHHIPVERFPANWDEYGKSAGYRRNEDMANYADELIAFWDGVSKGTQHMINIMKNKNKPVTVILVKE